MNHFFENPMHGPNSPVYLIVSLFEKGSTDAHAFFKKSDLELTEGQIQFLLGVLHGLDLVTEGKDGAHVLTANGMKLAEKGHKAINDELKVKFAPFR